MSEWLARNLPCESCGSSDAVQESTHHFKCFSCGVVKKKGDSSEAAAVPSTLLTGVHKELKSRGLTLDTCKAFNIQVTQYTGSMVIDKQQSYLNNEWVFLFNYYNGAGVVAQKIRPIKDKAFKFIGEKTKELFGSQHFKPHKERPIIITEGEFDAATVYQVTGYPTVSLTKGVQSLKNALEENYDYLSGFKSIILAIDNDEAALTEINKLLKSDFIAKLSRIDFSIVTWSGKDANEMLLNGDSSQISKDIHNRVKYEPDDLFTSSKIAKSILKQPEAGQETPFPALTKAIMGIRRNTIMTIAASDGIGKTEFLDEIIQHLIKWGKDPIWLYSCEQEVEDTFRRQCSKHLNLPLHIPGVPWNDKIIADAAKTIGDKLLVWQPREQFSKELMIAKMEYAAVSKGATIFFIDHLKGVESQMSDPIKGVASLFSDLKFFAKKYNVTVIILSHVAKDKRQGKPGQDDDSWSRGRVPSKENIYGSSAISAWSDTILALSRNIESTDPLTSRTTKVTLLKNRLMGNRGISHFYVKYDDDTGRLVEFDHPNIDYNGEDND